MSEQEGEGGDCNILELLNAVYALRLFRRVDEAAESGLELLSTRTMGHSTQAGAVPVDLAGLWVECALLSSLLLKLLR